MGIFGVKIEEKDYGLIPAGKYTGYISAVDEKTSKAGNKYIQLEFTLENNRKIWDNLHWHTTECINISAGKLKNIGFSDDERDELNPESIISAINFKKDGQNYEVNVGIKSSKDFGDQNNIRYFKKLDKNPF
jgi:hypothetical protein